MAHPDSIHVHILHQVNIINSQLFAAGSTRGRPECMPADTSENDLLVIYVDTIFQSYLDSPESKFLCHLMNNLFPGTNTYNNLITIWKLRIPESRFRESASDYCFTCSITVSYTHLTLPTNR